MTTDKARKRAVRTRMTKTGERYAAARRQVTGDRPAEPPALPPRIADPGMADAAIAKGSGAAWDDWFRILDAWGGAGRSHTEIARFLREDRGVSGWWAQAVTVGYERARGMRAIYETTRGFEVSVSKTIAARPEDVWPVILEARKRSRWLEPADLGARRRAGPVGRSATFEVPTDGTRVTIAIDPRGDARATVTVTHEALTDAADIEARRSAWRARLERLAGLWAPRATTRSSMR